MSPRKRTPSPVAIRAGAAAHSKVSQSKGSHSNAAHSKGEHLELLWTAAAAAARRSARQAPPAGRAPRGVAVLTARGTITSAPELGLLSGVGGSAECIALYRVLMERLGRIEVLVIAGGRTGRGDGGPPTAATLQVLHEFFPRAVLYWGTASRPRGGLEVRHLLPEAFTPAHLALTRGALPESSGVLPVRE